MTEPKAVLLKKGPRDAGRFGHPWIYKSQIQSVRGRPEPGDLVRVMGEKGAAGWGYFNPASEISVRLLTRREAPPDREFFTARFRKAAEFRKKAAPGAGAFRLVSSEADELPGLIVDQYGEVQVIQFLTLGMERLRPLVLETLQETLPCRGLYERSDSSSRRIEGLEPKTGWIVKNCGDEVEVHEGRVRYAVRFGEGHKTGFYLDQRENRLLLGELPGKGEALDAFCYEGGFGLHLAAAGWRVLGVDIQPEVLARAEENRRLNGISEEKLRFKAANVFDELKAMEKEGRKFDLVVLDPPSFVKKKAALEGALAGYKEILLRGMRLLNEGGLLAVFTCSYHVDEGLLMHSVMSAARDTRKNLRVLKFMKQSADHPINPFIPETYYLKGFLFEVSSL